MTVRAATLVDGSAIWRLVADSSVLDTNSCYCYLLLCRDFFETCVVACHNDDVIGFVTAYRRPKTPETIFVWQIGVSENARRLGIARRLLDTLVALPALWDARFLEANVTPSNDASRRLFEAFAKKRGADCQTLPGFTAEMFGDADHEEETLLRIGPLADSPSGETSRHDGSL